MQFSLLTFATLFSAAMASYVPRQNSQPTVQDAAMTDANGNVIAFDSANVYMASVAKGI